MVALEMRALISTRHHDANDELHYVVCMHWHSISKTLRRVVHAIYKLSSSTSSNMVSVQIARVRPDLLMHDW